MQTRPRSLAGVWLRVPTAVGIAALTTAAGAAQSPEPAAKLRPPVPITLQDGRLVTRGLSPEARPFDPTRGPQPSDPGRTPAGWPAPTYGPPKLMSDTTRAPWAATKPPSMLESAWSDVKEFVTGRSTEPVPGQHMPYTFTNPTAAPAPRTGTTGVYAGPPAYRWYGWGTTTPGTNPYAPSGLYPRGSGNWYAQTGATPGAFPVPVSAPRFTFGSEPPSYVGIPTSPPMAVEPIVHPQPRADRAPVVVEHSMSAVSVQPPANGTLTPLTTIPVPPRTPALPAAEVKPYEAPPSVPAGLPVPLTVIPSGATAEFPPTEGVSWQRSGTIGDAVPFTTASEPKPTPPVIQPPAPTTVGKKPSPLETAIRGACQGSATVTDFRLTGPNRLTVEVTSATNADARAAFEKVSTLPQLKAYEVQFEVKLTGR